MTVEERGAILRVAVSAALEDRGLDERERRRLADWRDSSCPGGDVPFKESGGTIEEATKYLARRAACELAFDAALAACSADGLRSDDETRFLARLAGALGLPHPHIVWRATIADALATLSLDHGGRVADDNGEEEVAKAATRCGALALLGQPLALLAIVAIELRLLHRLAGGPSGAGDADAARRLVLESGGGLASQVVDLLSAQSRCTDASADVGEAAEGGAARRAFAHAFAFGSAARQHTRPEAIASAGFLGRYVEGESQFTSHAESVEALAARIDPLRLPAFVRDEVPA